MAGIRGGQSVGLQQARGKLQFGKCILKAAKLIDHTRAHSGRQNFRTAFSDLGRIQTHPDLLNLRLPCPKFYEIAQVFGPERHRACDCAVNRNPVLADILQNLIVGCRGAAPVMFRRKAVDRNDNSEPLRIAPFAGNPADRACHYLGMNATLAQFREKLGNFPPTNQRLSSNYGKMKRPVKVNQGQDSPDKLRSF